MSSYRQMFPSALMGLILSGYALYVEHKTANKLPDEEFTALCDIEQIGASCSSVFQLPEARMLSYFGIAPPGSLLDVPNAAIGILYYTAWLVVLPFLPKGIKLLGTSLAMSSSIWLAIQLMKLQELCILCWTTHVINSRLWWSSFQEFRSSAVHSATRSAEGKAKVKRV